MNGYEPAPHSYPSVKFQSVSATAIANQAILKCTIAGFPLTVDNVILFVRDFVDPAKVACANFVEMIGLAIEEVIDCRDLVTRTAITKKSE